MFAPNSKIHRLYYFMTKPTGAKGRSNRQGAETFLRPRVAPGYSAFCLCLLIEDVECNHIAIFIFLCSN